jgi:hypothetical protein
MASTIRSQRKNQNVRQAMMISGLNTIYRNQSITHLIQTHQQTEPRIFLLDTTLEEMNQMYSKIHGIIEKGRLRPKGTELFFVYKKNEHLIFSEDAIYEIEYAQQPKHVSHMNNKSVINPCLLERIPIDGKITTIDLSISLLSDEPGSLKKSFVVPLLVDESYYKLSNRHASASASAGSYISPNHIVKHHTKIVVKLHPKSPNSFVLIMNENETEVLDFYFTTENGIIENSNEKITTTCKDEIISFIDHFKLCS